ncbi:protein mab-21-like 3 [Monodelphis domestica]|uniref:protein mab-21-like 3 n=1 Tax=Monodelphis domestica TaxID=13616 RepID=UPI0024E1E25E|nr:protein mab-21-like 3 [Monodelphis domestica]
MIIRGVGMERSMMWGERLVLLSQSHVAAVTTSRIPCQASGNNRWILANIPFLTPLLQPGEDCEVMPQVRLEIKTSVCQVEVELVPVVEIFNQWCDKAWWSPCLKQWPSQEKAECVKSIGFSLMACSSFHWQLNFSQAEYMVMEGIDEDGGCRKTCFQVLRQMKEDVWCPGNRPIITSQHLKMVLFWTCKKYPHAKDWKNFTVSFLCLVRKLHKCVSQHFLRHYFVDGNNMFQYVSINDLDAIAQKLTLFLENPGLCWT